MAGLAQTTINKMSQVYQRLETKIPAEITPRNVLLFCVIDLLCIGSVMVASASMPFGYSRPLASGLQLCMLHIFRHAT